MIDLLTVLAAAGILDPVDVAFARSLAHLNSAADPRIILGAAFASRAVSRGSVCVDLHRLCDQRLVDGEGAQIPDATLPRAFEWILALGCDSEVVGDGSAVTPLVLDDKGRLYLYRYFRYERMLAAQLLRRSQAVRKIDHELARATLTQLFVGDHDHAPDPVQCEAVAVAALRNLTVLSGGPGTGKTTTIVRILALLQTLALAQGNRPLRVVLTAPTGKAAARMSRAISDGLETLPCKQAVRDAIVPEASTLHRLLGWRPGTPTQFTHHHARPIVADVIVVDEASMVDLALMAKFVDAVPASAQLVLVGDKHQLASVEAGAILGDMCNADLAAGPGRSQAFTNLLERLLPVPLQPRPPGAAPIGDCVVELVRNYRFDADGPVSTLATTVRAGDSAQVLSHLTNSSALHDSLVRMETVSKPQQLIEALTPDLLAGFAPYLKCTDVGQRLAQLGRYRILCAHRRGPFGVEHLNQVIEQVLMEHGLIDPSGPWYDGRAILITQNDAQMGLFNGDVGLLHRDHVHGLRAAFETPDGGIRQFSPAQLPAFESVWAMTVHKSQGSEFDKVGFVTPVWPSPLLTRELIYTAVTRARRELVLYGSAKIIADAVRQQVDRSSGLRDLLWG